MKKLFLLAGSNLILICAISQSIRSPASAPYLLFSAFGKKPDAFAFSACQASLPELKNPMVAVFGEQKFGLSENSYYSAAVVYPASPGNFGLVLHYSGFSVFKEYKIGMAYGKSLGKVNAGIQFNYYGYSLPEYENRGALSADASLLIIVSPDFKAGITVLNALSTPISENEKLPIQFSLSMGYHASDEVLLLTSLLSEQGRPTGVLAGIEYQFKEKFFIRAGLESSSKAGFAGAGVLWKGMRLDVICSFHQYLGISPGILIASSK